MGGARNDFESYLAPHLCPRLFVQINNDLIIPTDNQKRGSSHRRQCAPRQIGPPATRDDRADVSREFSRGDERGGAAGARSKVTKAQVLRSRLAHHPLGSVDEALGQQVDVESMLRSLNIERFLFGCEQIEKEVPESGLVQNSRDKLIARAMPAAAAAVHEEDQHRRTLRNCKTASQCGWARENADFGVHV